MKNIIKVKTSFYITNNKLCCFIKKSNKVFKLYWGFFKTTQSRKKFKINKPFDLIKFNFPL